MNGINVGIIGHGFVGKAVAHGFNCGNNIAIADPLLNSTTQNVLDSNPDVIFICAPTPMGQSGEIDSTIIDSIINELNFANYKGIVVLKSTVTPDIVKSYAVTNKNFIYNPEFLTEAHALIDFENATHHVFGGNIQATKILEKYYNENSICIDAPKYHMSAVDASFVKYGINSFLALKVLFFNQYYDAIENFGGSYIDAIVGITGDPRIGSSHTIVPGPDRKRGFGGACFPKDVSAICKLFPSLSLMTESIDRNNEYRSQYSLDEREKLQNVKYNRAPISYIKK